MRGGFRKQLLYNLHRGERTDVSLVQADNSGHFIHMTEPGLIEDGLLWIEKNAVK